MLNTMIVAAVTNFSGTTTPDKNGAVPVMLQCVAGQMPNRNVLSGTVAERAGFEVGKTYLVNVRETGYDEVFGPDYTFVKVKELTTGLDIVQSAMALGEARILYVQRPEGFEQHYQRTGDAVESNRTKRIQQGLYRPTAFTTVGGHETAKEVRSGTSVGSGGTIINEAEMLQHVHDLDEGEPFPEPNENEEEQSPENEKQSDSDTNTNQNQTNSDKPQGQQSKRTRGGRG